MKRRKQDMLNDMTKDFSCCFGCGYFNFNRATKEKSCAGDRDPSICGYSKSMAKMQYDDGMRRCYAVKRRDRK